MSFNIFLSFYCSVSIKKLDLPKKTGNPLCTKVYFMATLQIYALFYTVSTVFVAPVLVLL